MGSIRFFLPALIIAGAIFGIYAPALHGGWVRDDLFYLPGNVLRDDPDWLWKLWFQPGSFVEYYPLQATLQGIQWRLWGNDTFGYHLTNVLLHLVSALLVWRLLAKFGLKFAWVGGLIFAVHPMQVESVATISEFKSTLSLPPFLLAMGAWIDYEEHRRPRDYGLALGCFVAAMLCKTPMPLSPAVMLLYAWWKRGRIGWDDLKASLPFWGVALVLAGVTYEAGQDFAQTYLNEQAVVIGGVFQHLALAGMSAAFYLGRCFWPVDPLPLYPLWSLQPLTPWHWLPWVGLGLAGFGLWSKRKSWGKHAILGLGFFFLFLAPFLGFIGISYMKTSWVSDHFLYIPLIGLIGLVVAAMDRLATCPPVSRLGGALLVALAILTMSWQSRLYAGMYHDSATLWSYQLQLDPQSWLARNNLGTDLVAHGKADEAMQQYQEALRLKPDEAATQSNIGSVLLQTHRVPEAVQAYEEAVRFDPGYDKARYNLGNALALMGRNADAEVQLREALRLNPHYAMAHDGLGHLLMAHGQLDEAKDEFEQAVALDPHLADAQASLGLILQQTGGLDGAVAHEEEALRLNPRLPGLRSHLGVALAQSGQMPAALDMLESAVQADPKDVESRVNLGLILTQQGKLPEAIMQLQEAVKLKPDLALGYYSLGQAFLQSDRNEEAIAEFKQALVLQPNFVPAYNALGIALASTGHKPQAMEAFRQALQIDPHNANARANLDRLRSGPASP